MLWEIKGKVSVGDYDYAIVPDHPNRNKNNYVFYHRVVMENLLGRLLTEDEVVHHKNGNKKDNRPENLEVMTREEHTRLHASRHGKKMVKLKCPCCGKIFVRRRGETFLDKHTKYNCTCCSRECGYYFSGKIQRQGVTEEIQKAIDENLIEEFVGYKYEDACHDQR